MLVSTVVIPSNTTSTASPRNIWMYIRWFLFSRYPCLSCCVWSFCCILTAVVCPLGFAWKAKPCELWRWNSKPVFNSEYPCIWSHMDTDLLNKFRNWITSHRYVQWVPLVDVDGGNTQVASALKFCQCEEVRDKLLFSFSCFKLDDNDNYNSPKDRRNMKKTYVLSIAVYI